MIEGVKEALGEEKAELLIDAMENQSDKEGERQSFRQVLMATLGREDARTVKQLVHGFIMKGWECEEEEEGEEGKMKLRMQEM